MEEVTVPGSMEEELSTLVVEVDKTLRGVKRQLKTLLSEVQGNEKKRIEDAEKDRAARTSMASLLQELLVGPSYIFCYNY